MIKDGKRIVNVMLITIASRISGFIREITLASVYGATLFTDAYIISTTIPSVIFTGIGTALASVFITIYPSIIQKQGRDEAIDFTNNVLNIVFLATVIISILALAVVKPIVSVFAIGFKEEIFEVTVKFTRILLPGIIFIGIYYVFTGYLETNKKFEIPVFAKIPYNILIIICIFLSSNVSIDILLYGTLAGLLVQAIILGCFAWRSGYTYRFRIHLKDKNIKKMLLLIIPIFIGIAVQQLNVLVDKTLASTLSEGSISALNFADRLNSFVYGVFVLSIVNVVYPTISELAANEDIEMLREYIRQSIRLINLLVIPLSVGAMCLSTPIVRILFQRGNFNSSDTLLTSGALFYYSIGMIGLGLSTFLAKVFYSLQDTGTPVRIGAISIASNIILNFILVRYMAHEGLALATSISSIFGAVLLLYRLKCKLNYFGGRSILDAIKKVCLASTLMFVGVKLFYENIIIEVGESHMGELFTLFISVVFGGFVYFSLLMLLKMEEANQLFSTIKKSAYHVLTNSGIIKRF